MKNLLSTFVIITAAGFAVLAGSSIALAEPSTAIRGEVLEVKDVESYTYLRLKTTDGETWAAITKTPVKKGAAVTIENVMVMNNFESKSLKKTFPTIIFGSLGGAGTAAPLPGADMSTAHASLAKNSDAVDILVPKASGSNARTVAEIVGKAKDLRDKTVVVRGKIVKYNPEIMGKNWIHLRDGSGSAAENTNDVLVTTTNQAKIGDIVLVKGVVRLDKDFGAGYLYKVVIEDATLQQ
jgi:hypothetical protein